MILNLSAAYSTPKNLPVPRFVTIKSNEVNSRKGPGTSYPIEWIYIRKGEPVEIIAEFDQWRKIRDMDNNIGWIHSSVLSGKRTLITKETTPINMYFRPNLTSVVIAKIAPGVRCYIKKCNQIWCKTICDNQTGWINRKNNLWGIYSSEEKIK